MHSRFVLAAAALVLLAGSAALPAMADAPELLPREAFLRQADARLAGLVLLKATGSNVRLRKGPGTSHEAAGVANKNGEGWHAELVASREKVSGEGRQWYHVLYLVEKEVDTAYIPADVWICADFVKASALAPAAKAEIASEHFGIYDFRFFGIETAGGRTLSVPSRCLSAPALSFREPVVLERETEDGVRAVKVPAGTRLALCEAPVKWKGRLLAELCEPLGQDRVRMLGSLPVDELEARPVHVEASPEDLPAFSFAEPVRLLRDRGPKSSAEAPAGTRMVPLGYALQMDAADLGEAFIALWEPLGDGRLRWLGYMPLEALKARSGYHGEQAVRNWTARLDRWLASLARPR